jgi:hypothetical protein
MKQYKWTIIMDDGNQYFKEKKIHPKIYIMPHIKIWWIDKKSTWCFNDGCKQVVLELFSSYSYIIVIKLHKLHLHMVSHIVSCIYCNSCNLFDNIHTHRNTLNYNELQIIIVILKSNYKANCNSPHFFIKFS